MAKIIANRLKPYLNKLILPNQGGFVANRQIWDNIIFMQEAIHSSVSWRVKGMVVKVDMANAFDRVKQSFLKAILEKIGFNKVFVSWIGACISNPCISPLVNGRPASFFKASRGIRHGFPLPPYYMCSWLRLLT
jgi:hypothetical protein